MASKPKQLKYWQGKFGDDYIKRNSDLAVFKKRRPFFKKNLILHKDITSVLEIGCNIGGNLFVISAINSSLQLVGIEPNKKAAKIASELTPNSKIINQSVFDLKQKKYFDLVFTSGVLIHIADKDLPRALKKIYQASKKYILTIEYYSPKKETIHYRGLNDALFKRPYDKVWIKIYPKLKLLAKGFLDMSHGFDKSHWWLFQK